MRKALVSIKDKAEYLLLFQGLPPQVERELHEIVRLADAHVGRPAQGRAAEDDGRRGGLIRLPIPPACDSSLPSQALARGQVEAARRGE